MISRMVVGLGLSIALSAVGKEAGADPKSGAVVAVVGGHSVTLTELEQKQAAKLLAVRYQYYLAQRQALDQLIEDHLLEDQARREHLTVEQLLERHVAGEVKDPTEEQLQVYYEGVETKEPFAVVRNNILGHLRQLRTAKARAAYVQSLRDQTSIHVALAPPSGEVDIANAPARGPRDAPVVIVEFADYECPYCQRIHPELKKLQDDFPGKVALIFKDSPLPNHPRAHKAAEAARCAGEQGRFWEFQDLLFDGSRKLEATQLKEAARDLKLDGARFDQCLDSGAQAAGVQKDFAQGQRLGLTGTPSFFINGHFLSGAVKYSTLREVVEQQLAATPGAPKSARR
jgi:protein-disulfide isomerase